MVFVLFFVTTSRCGQTLLFTKTYVIMSNKKDFWTVGRPQDVIFGIFCHFSSPITPLKMISQPKKNVNFRLYDFPQHFKYLIGFCASPFQMVQPEIDFWGCEKTVKDGPGRKLCNSPGRGKMGISISHIALDLLSSQLGGAHQARSPTKFLSRGDIRQILSPPEKGQFLWVFLFI